MRIAIDQKPALYQLRHIFNWRAAGGNIVAQPVPILPVLRPGSGKFANVRNVAIVNGASDRFEPWRLIG